MVSLPSVYVGGYLRYNFRHPTRIPDVKALLKRMRIPPVAGPRRRLFSSTITSSTTAEQDTKRETKRRRKQTRPLRRNKHESQSAVAADTQLVDADNNMLLLLQLPDDVMRCVLSFIDDDAAAAHRVRSVCKTLSFMTTTALAKRYLRLATRTSTSSLFCDDIETMMNTIMSNRRDFNEDVDRRIQQFAQDCMVRNVDTPPTMTECMLVERAISSMMVDKRNYNEDVKKRIERFICECIVNNNVAAVEKVLTRISSDMLPSGNTILRVLINAGVDEATANWVIDRFPACLDVPITLAYFVAHVWTRGCRHNPSLVAVAKRSCNNRLNQLYILSMAAGFLPDTISNVSELCRVQDCVKIYQSIQPPPSDEELEYLQQEFLDNNLAQNINIYFKNTCLVDYFQHLFDDKHLRRIQF